MLQSHYGRGTIPIDQIIKLKFLVFEYIEKSASQKQVRE